MATLIELYNAPKGMRYIMEMFEDGVKIAQDDISEMTCRQLGELIELQEMQGRTWEYKTINLKKKSGPGHIWCCPYHKAEGK